MDNAPDNAQADAQTNVQASRLKIRLAQSPADVQAACRLRYDVFCNEQRGEAAGGIDGDAYDPVCRHLIVFDQDTSGRETAVGTYRLIDTETAEAVGGFYSGHEFVLEPLLHKAARDKLTLLEVGRSCVHPDYRSQGVMTLMWRALAAYARRSGTDVLFGCASFPGTDLAAIAPALRYLHDHHAAGEQWGVRAREDLRIPLDSASPPVGIPNLPPLIKGYLRLGGRIADGAVCDKVFGSIDVCVLVDMAGVPARYGAFFAPERDNFASHGSE